MTLALHQLRYEFRRSRIGLFLYGLVLFCNLAVTLGWIGAPSLHPDARWDHGNLVPVLALLAFWIAFTSVVANCVVADSPARRDRFLATRPMPVSSLLAGKALYLALAVLLPAALIEAISLASTGAGIGTIVRGSAEQLLLCGTLALAIGAFAAHWKSIQGFLFAVIVSFVAVMILGRLVGELFANWARANATQLTHPPTYLTIIQGIAVLAAGLALTAWVCARNGLRYRFLVPALIPVAAAATATMLTSPLRNPAYRPDDQASIDRLLESGTATARLLPQGHYISDRGDGPNLDAGASFAPRTSGFPDDLELQWDTFRHAWTVGGTIVEAKSNDRHQLAQHFVSPDAVPVSWALAQTIQNHLGTRVVFYLDAHGAMSHSTSVSPGSLTYDPAGPLPGQQARVEALVAGDAFRWSVAADLPLEAGQSGRDGTSTWSIASVHPGVGDFRIALSERTVSLHTSGDLAVRKEQYPWRTRNRFVLYLPTRQLAWFGETQYPRAVPGISGTTRYIGEIEFGNLNGTDWSHQAPAFKEELADARLLILRHTYVGRVVEEWSSPTFVLRASEDVGSAGYPDYEPHERWNPTQFALWFDRWEKLDSSAPSELVHAHFLDLFANVERLDRSLHTLREPAILYAARFVPRHLDFLLDQLAESRSQHTRVATFLTRVIALGADDSQSDLILARLSVHSALDEVIDLRGWQDRALPHRIAILKESPTAGARYLDDLLARNDPSLDSLILDAYRAAPSVHAFRSLRQVPRLADEAESITREFWKPGRIVLNRNRYLGRLEFGLSLGRPEALDELFAILDHTAEQIDNSWNLAELISSNFHVPKDEQGRHAHDPAYIKWAATHQASDFRFDPVLRRFALKAANSTI